MSYPSWEADPYQDEEEVEEEKDAEGNIKDREYIVFLVDCGEEMFVKLPIKQEGEGEQPSSFSIVVNTMSEFMRKRIMAAAKDEFAVIFYNTDKADNPNNHKNVYLLVQRDVPNADTIQQLRALTDEKFHADIGSLKSADPKDYADALKNGLWTTMDVLQANHNKHARNRVFLFSNQEDPFAKLPKAHHANYRQNLLDRAATLQQTGTSMRFFPLIAASRPFNMQLFWNSLLAQLRDPDDEYDPSQQSQHPATASLPATQAPGIVSSADDVMERLRCLSEYMRKCLQRRRATTTLRWTITDDLQISCQVYDLLVEAKRPYSVRIRAEDSVLVVSETAIISQDTGALLPKVEFKSWVPEKANGRFPKTVFSLDEIAAVKYYMPPGLKLIGFKPRSCLQDFHNLTHSSFVRPTERDVRGSTTVFRALLQAMVAKDNIAICSYVRTKRSEPVLVALLPQQEELDDQNYQVWAEGLHMIRLPFKDDVRHPDTDPTQVGTTMATAGSDQVEAATALVKQLQYLDFNMGAVSNPVLDRHFEVLEATALDMEPPPLTELQDNTLPPDAVEIEKTAGAQLEAFKAAVGLNAEAEKGSGKRKAATQDLPTAELYAQKDWDALIRENKLAKLTIPDLKVYLKFHRLPQSGNKGDLVARITKHRCPDA